MGELINIIQSRHLGYMNCFRDKQFKDDLAKMKEELGKRQEAKAEAAVES